MTKHHHMTDYVVTTKVCIVMQDKDHHIYDCLLSGTALVSCNYPQMY